MSRILGVSVEVNGVDDLASVLTGDSFYFLWNQFMDDMEHLLVYRNILAVVGAVYLTKTAIRFLTSVISGVTTHYISRYNPVCLPNIGKWAVVTGPTEGIGKAFAEELAKRGMCVLLLGRNAEKLKELSDFIQEKYNRETKIVIIDFNNPGKAYEKIKEVFDALEIGIVVNNVGTINGYPSFLHEMNDDDIMRMLKVNIESVTKMTQLAVAHMRKRKQGFIVNVSSIASVAPAPLLQVYAATKAYVTSFSRAVNAEVKSDGITVQTLIPSYVKTRMVDYSQRLTTSLLIPSPETYVQNALRTLSYSSYTTGYWFHGIQASFVSLFPVTWYMYIIRKTNLNFRSEYLLRRSN